MKLPTYKSQVMPSMQGTIPDPVLHSQTADAIGQLGQHAGQISSQWISNIQKAEAADQFSSAMMTYTTSMNDFKLELAKDPDWENYGTKLEEYKSKLYMDVRSNLKNFQAVDAFDKAFAQDIEQKRVEVLSIQGRWR